MTTTARRALTELIDQLCAPPVEQPATAPVLVPAVPPAPQPVPAVAPALPVQRVEAPVVRPAAMTVLPGGARSAILWRSRSA